MKLRKAAAVFNIKPNTLFYRIKKYKENKPNNDQMFSSKYTVAQVFTKEEERMLKEYLLKSSKMNYGLTYRQARSLAYEYATALKKCPIKWTEKQEAGMEWLKGFMKRHKELSLRKPENTSLSRSTSFNKHNVTQFYENYEKVLKRTNFTPERIYNLDETNIMTVVQAPNVIARKGTKQIGQCVSAERGQLITMCAIVNAIGNALPPDWLLAHPGKTITIHDLASILTPAYNASHTARNIIAGFMKPGIHPFSRNAFCDEDFECAEVTNRPMPTTSSGDTSDVPQISAAADDTDCEDVVQEINFEGSPTATALDIPVTSSAVSPSVLDTTSVLLEVASDVGPSVPVPETWAVPTVAASAAVTLTPEVVRPFPIAPPRKPSLKGRKKGKSRILTDTPEKEEIQKAYLERQARLKKSQERKEKANPKRVKPKRKKTKTILTFSSDETDSEICLESEEEPTMSSEDKYRDDNEDVDYETDLNCNINCGDFVLTQLASEGNKRSLAFVGKVIAKQGHDFTVSFLKKKGASYKFFFPEKEDESYVSMSDILVKLPPPIEAAGTSRTAAMIAFKFNFSNFRLG